VQIIITIFVYEINMLFETQIKKTFISAAMGTIINIFYSLIRRVVSYTDTNAKLYI